ncbi:hypothetical protein GCM10010346_63070 [Streptomyces chryseus]|uniref:Uncharacterized protein n=1 Tax=Streptomyces chryseus TaxID=68186 RepID=A0ABQ3EBG3_9ACTN|nr:hypothetical protein GCM10010346_63070 [Streptomyces chryseus]
MEGEVVLIVHESGVPCQVDPVRFTPVQARQASRVTGSPSSSFSFTQFVPEVGFPVGSYKSSTFGAGSLRAVAASAAPLMHPMTEVINNCLGGGVREGSVPCGGTGSKILARRAGVPGGIRVERALSTGRLVQGRRVDHETAANGGVRFGVYTGPMATQTVFGSSASAVFTAPVGAVGR